MSGAAPPVAQATLEEVAGRLEVEGRLASAVRWGSGHINDTFAATFEGTSGPFRLILQRLNRHVFPEPEKVMENASAVTRHLHARLAASGVPDADRRALRLVPTRSGAAFLLDAAGEPWRAWRFVERARSVDVVSEPRTAFEAARAFGEFQRLLLDYDGPPLHETLPRFHHTPTRWARLVRAAAADTAGRAAGAAAEIDFALEREPLSRLLVSLQESGDAPVRATHNDTKVNNVLLDEATGEGLCVIDLDTVMPGLSLYDFGDLVRTAASPSAEDELDLSKVGVRDDLFAALVRGYLSATGSFLTRAERECLVGAAKVIVFTIGLRFLTDHLEGDVYFRIHREGHNLDRARTQLALLRSLEGREDTLRRLALSAAEGL